MLPSFCYKQTDTCCWHLNVNLNPRSKDLSPMSVCDSPSIVIFFNFFKCNCRHGHKNVLNVTVDSLMAHQTMAWFGPVMHGTLDKRRHLLNDSRDRRTRRHLKGTLSANLGHNVLLFSSFPCHDDNEIMLINSSNVQL